MKTKQNVNTLWCNSQETRVTQYCFLWFEYLNIFNAPYIRNYSYWKLCITPLYGENKIGNARFIRDWVRGCMMCIHSIVLLIKVLVFLFSIYITKIKTNVLYSRPQHKFFIRRNCVQCNFVITFFSFPFSFFFSFELLGKTTRSVQSVPLKGHCLRTVFPEDRIQKRKELPTLFFLQNIFL